MDVRWMQSVDIFYFLRLLDSFSKFIPDFTGERIYVNVAPASDGILRG